MMFLSNIAFSTAIVTLALGFALLAWSKREIPGRCVLKTGGTIVLILSVLNMLCVGYHAARKGGDFKGRMGRYDRRDESDDRRRGPDRDMDHFMMQEMTRPTDDGDIDLPKSDVPTVPPVPSMPTEPPVQNPDN